MRKNKKLMIFMLTLTMILTSISPVFASQRSLTISEVSVENFENNKDAKIELKVNNKSDKSITTNLIVGLYERFTNEMITYNYISDEIDANGEKSWGDRNSDSSRW